MIGRFLAVLFIALAISVDMDGIPGIWRDNPNAPGKIAAYIFLGIFTCLALGAAGAAWTYGRRDWR